MKLIWCIHYPRYHQYTALLQFCRLDRINWQTRLNFLKISPGLPKNFPFTQFCCCWHLHIFIEFWKGRALHEETEIWWLYKWNSCKNWLNMSIAWHKEIEKYSETHKGQTEQTPQRLRLASSVSTTRGLLCIILGIPYMKPELELRLGLSKIRDPFLLWTGGHDGW